jgi:hypothetical protein
MLGGDRARAELRDELAGERAQVERLLLHRQPARVEAREVEQLRRELRQPVDLLAHLAEELAPGGLVQVGVLEQLEEAAEREERVRSSCEALAMNSPRARSRSARRRRIRSNERASWPSSSEPIGHRLAEVAGRDPVRRLLEAPDPAREHAGADVAEQRCEGEREPAGHEHAPAHDRHGLELLVERQANIAIRPTPGNG